MSPSVTTIDQFLPIISNEPPGVISQRLNQEWEEYAQHPPTWLSSASTLHQILNSIRHDPDHVLTELLTACQDGHVLAGRTIIQALLPKIILMSTANPFPPVEHILSALWIRIAHYPLTKRPHSIAANLVLDARKDAVAECRSRVIIPVNSPTTVHDDNQINQEHVHTIIDLARHMELATAQSLNILEKVYLDGLPSARVAELFTMTPAAVRRRVSDTVRRLRENRHLFDDLVFN
ncbi:MAG: hypothetical protein FWG08_04915 [Propionibacteriaceae bacterium]|jgi:hypothetical protein|nr:hypothetical protein [Propionibacteriaceae bacterium]